MSASPPSSKQTPRAQASTDEHVHKLLKSAHETGDTYTASACGQLLGERTALRDMARILRENVKPDRNQDYWEGVRDCLAFIDGRIATSGDYL